MRGRRHPFRSERCRGLISLTLLLSLGMGYVPLPLVSDWTSAKIADEPFPCQNKPCGCAKADDCWKKCCCFTNKQKVAWAKRHAVTLPTSVMIAAANEPSGHDSARLQTGTGTPETAIGTSAGYRLAQGSKRAPVIAGSKIAGSKKVTTVLGIEMQKCRHASSFWNLLPWAVLTTADCTELFVTAPDWDIPRSIGRNLFHHKPAEPPPRRVSA